MFKTFVIPRDCCAQSLMAAAEAEVAQLKVEIDKMKEAAETSARAENNNVENNNVPS